MSLICALMGTPWEIDTKNRILILEDIDEPLYKIDACDPTVVGRQA